ncbi:MAG: hypothetical protein C0514_01745 [Candidatus Puniceispirillum sp.]|nr:hypothetical protein [Candidatus Puniceispirillum sp.]
MKKMLLTAMCFALGSHGALFASAQPEAIFEGAQGAPAPTRLFQGERDALQAAKAAFIANPTPETLGVAIANIPNIFAAMHGCNEEDTTHFDPVAVSRFLADTEALEREHLQIPSELFSETVQAHYMNVESASSQEAQRQRVRVLSTYLNKLAPEGSTAPTAVFAFWGLAQQKSYATLQALKNILCERQERAVNAQLKEVSASSDFDQEFVSRFWALPQSLQNLLIITKGDQTHKEWLPHHLMSGEDAQHADAWREICAMECDALKEKVASLVEAHGKVSAKISESETARQAFYALGVYETYNTTFNAVSCLYWAAEKAIFDAIIKDQNSGVTKSESAFKPLLRSWRKAEKTDDSTESQKSEKGEKMGPRDMIHLTLVALMKKRFALTYMFIAKELNPAALEEAARKD